MQDLITESKVVIPNRSPDRTAEFEYLAALDGKYVFSKRGLIHLELKPGGDVQRCEIPGHVFFSDDTQWVKVGETQRIPPIHRRVIGTRNEWRINSRLRVVAEQIEDGPMKQFFQTDYDIDDPGLRTLIASHVRSA